MSAVEIQPSSRPHPLRHRNLFAIGDRVRVPSIPHWPAGRIAGIDEDGKPRIEWDNGFVDVFNWLPIERVGR
jgi:hypothetical protein